MAKQSPKAQISGGKAAGLFANALRTTRSTLSRNLGAAHVPATPRHQRGGYNVPFGAPRGRPTKYTVTEWGAGVALDERADGPLVLKWA
jgi:hypothetical protein